MMYKNKQRILSVRYILQDQLNKSVDLGYTNNPGLIHLKSVSIRQFHYNQLMSKE